MQICAPLTRSQCKISETQVTVRPVGLLFKVTIYIHEDRIRKNVMLTKQNALL